MSKPSGLNDDNNDNGNGLVATSSTSWSDFDANKGNSMTQKFAWPLV
jgi:hypothetical protein